MKHHETNINQVPKSAISSPRDVLTRHERRPAWKCYFHNLKEPPQSVKRPVRHKRQLSSRVLAGSENFNFFCSEWRHRSTSRTVQFEATLRRQSGTRMVKTCENPSLEQLQPWATVHQHLSLKPCVLGATKRPQSFQVEAPGLKKLEVKFNDH